MKCFTVLKEEFIMGMRSVHYITVPEIHVGVQHGVVAEELHPLLGDAPALPLRPGPLAVPAFS